MKDHFKEIKRYNYNPEAFTDLKFKRIDEVLVGYGYVVQQMTTDPSYKVVGESLAKAEIVIVLPKDADALTAQVNQALQRIKDNGNYEQVYNTLLRVEKAKAETALR